PLIGGALIETIGTPAFALIMGAVSLIAIVPTAIVARVSVGAERALARSGAARVSESTVA
ncbi:hypothetical protein XM48_00500, partial [Leucobacter sp. Ag1]